MVEVAIAAKKKAQGDNYVLYCGDCVEGLKTLESEKIGFVLFSPPFVNLYTFSDDPADFGNSNYGDFFQQFRFLSNELFRVMMPGRIVAIHCVDLPTFKRNGEEIGLEDFSGDIVRLFKKTGFIYHSRHCIWKDPLVAATRTKAIGLAHKQIVKDSAMCRMGIPDYILAFRKPGENPEPICHPNGLTEYPGSKSIPKDLDSWSGWDGEQRENKRSQWIWQQIASPVWMDVRQTKVLPFRQGKEPDDLKHISPFQLDVVERCIILWSNPGDIVLDPFGGIGTTACIAVKMERKAISFELKESYWRQSCRNIKAAVQNKESLFDNTDGES